MNRLLTINIDHLSDLECRNLLKEIQKSKSETKSEIRYVHFSLIGNCGCDMDHLYFVQYDGNENEIQKFKNINKDNDALFFYDQEKYHQKWSNPYYTEKEIINMKGLVHQDSGQADSVECKLLKGKLNIPERNENEDICDWWKTHFGYAKYPEWNDRVEIVYDLM